MKLSHLAYRRILIILAAIVVAVALALAFGVIKPVEAEVARGGTPQKAVYAFWANIGIGLLSAVALTLIAARSKGRRFGTTSAQVVVGLIVLFLGFALGDAASAYRSHGPAMQTASTLLFVLAVVEFLAGALVVTATFFQPRKV